MLTKVIVREPNSENCLDLIFATAPYEKVIIVPDKDDYITSAIRKFMLDMPSPGSFQNIGPFNMSTTGLRACETIWLKLSKNEKSSIENQLAQSDSSLNADQKWYKNPDNRVHPYRVTGM